MTDNHRKKRYIGFTGEFSSVADIISTEGSEGFCQSFSFNLHINTHRSFKNMSDYIGRSVGLKIDFDDDQRYIHGIITEIKQISTDADFSARKSEEEDIAFIGTQYTLKIESSLALLKKNITCQVHSAKKAMDVVFDVLKKYHIHYDSSRLSTDASAAQTRVQYNQSDYHFISEILQSIGVYYFFIHSEDSHCLMFYDSLSQLDNLGGENYTLSEIYGLYGISGLTQQQTLVPSSVKMNGYNIANNVAFSQEGSVKLKIQNNIDICHYTDSFLDDQERLHDQIKFRTGQLFYASAMGKIANTSPSIVMGKRFKLNSNEYAPELEIDYFISEISLKASNSYFRIIDGEEKINEGKFLAELTVHPYIEGTCYYSPFNICRQLISGTLSAFITGPEKEDIHTDEYGRVQIRFLWQPEKYGTEFNQKDYCWARISQVWSGRDMGGQFIPRVGSEVLVSFLNGDPNYPLVTGCVFNGNNKPPFDLENAQSKTCSGFISHNTVKDSRMAGHQLCFQDKKEEEFILLQSQKDLHFKAENDATLTVSNGSYTVKIEKGKIKISCADDIEVSSKNGIRLSVEDSQINITPEQVKISSPEVTVNAKGETTLSAKGKVSIISDGEAEVSAHGLVNINGLKVKLN